MKVVIIGSGRTGRGFIAPFFYHNKDEIVFVDEDKELIDLLKTENNYNIYNFTDNEVLNISGYKAYTNYEAIEEIANSDVVVISVFANNLDSLVPILKESIKIRQKDNKLLIICAENGINVKKKLIKKSIDANITEAAIFCTSVNENGLNIISEKDVPLFVNDYFDFNIDINVPGIRFINKFENLMKRKIYTYNFLSAVIAYYGYYKNHKNLADSYEDLEIKNFISEYSYLHDEIMARNFGVGIDEQKDFTTRAINKFSNHLINDGIKRNAQQVERKLKSDERLIFPLNLAIIESIDELIIFYSKIIALAINYGVKTNELNEEEYFKIIENNVDDPKVAQGIERIYKEL